MPFSKRLARFGDLFALIVLASVNLFVAGHLITIEYLDHFNSIEGSFIAIARYLTGHWGDHSWWPIWHCGMPYQDTYVPLLHFTVAGLASVAHFSAAQAYHVVVAVAYIAGPLTLYILAVKLGASRAGAFLGALIYSLFSPSALLMPAVAADMGGYLNDRRLQVLTLYGEGPHITAMTILPLAIAALAYALHKRSGRAFGLAALALAVIFLTNVPGTMATGLAVFCWLAAQPAGERRAAWTLAAAAALFGYAIACYGIPPSAERTVLANVGGMHAGFSAAAKWAPLLLAALLGAVAGLGYLLCRRKVALHYRFSLLFFALLAPLVLTADMHRFELLPQVGRLHLELEMAVALLAGPAIWWIYERSGKRTVVLLLIGGVTIAQAIHYRGRAEAADLRVASLAKQSEYASAHWVDENLRGQRVFVTGSASFWWNAFTDSPQVLGCCDQGELLPVLPDVKELVASSSGDWTLTKAYLQALGAQALVVSGPDSTDDDKDIQTPARFDALLPALHRELGDTIYAIPQRSRSLAHVVGAGDTVSASARDASTIRYAAAIQDSTHPSADFAWLSGDTARIVTKLTPADVVSLQIPAISGWEASVGGKAVPIDADGLGFQVLRPQCNGACEITLHWNGRADRIPTMLVSLLALAGLIVLLVSRSVDHAFHHIG